MPTETKAKILEQFKGILTLINEGLTKDDFVKSFEKLAKLVMEIKDDNEKFREEVKQDLIKAINNLQTDSTTSKEDLQKLINDTLSDTLERIAAKEQAIDERLIAVKDGKDADEEVVTTKVIERIKFPDPIIDTPEQVRDKLETLEGEERLDKKAIKGLEDLEKEVKKTTNKYYGGSRGVDLYVDGSLKGLTQYINFIAGTNVTLSYNTVGARTDITIDASGGGAAMSVLAATGTVNDSNTTFTFPSAPTLVVVNGASYRHGHGVTIAGTSVTLDNPVGTGGDIYGLG